MMRKGLSVTKITQKYIGEYSDDNLSDLVFKIFAPESDINLSKISEPARTVISIYSSQGVIDYSSDLYYFFESDFPQVDAYDILAQSYKNIGHSVKAEALVKVLSLFPQSKPHKNLSKREKFLDKHFGDEPHPTVAWAEDILCNDSEKVYADTMNYFRENYKE